MKSIIRLPISSNFKILVSTGEKVSSDSIIAKSSASSLETNLEISKLLKIKPKKLMKYLVVKVGESIKKNQEVARKKSFLSTLLVKSPVDGKIKEVDIKKGIVVISKGRQDFVQDIKSPISGKVKNIIRDEIQIEVSGKVFKAKKAEGKNVQSTLLVFPGKKLDLFAIDTKVKNSIVVCNNVDDDVTVKLDALGAIGVISLSEIPDSSLSWVQVGLDEIKKLSEYKDKNVLLRPKEKEIVVLD